MANPLASIKRLFQDSPPTSGRSAQTSLQRCEKDFMKFDLTADARY